MSENQKYSVLLVDDDRFLLDMYATKFSREGYAVQAFLSADEALGALRGGLAVDAVVFDLVMPGKDGFGLLQAIQDEHLASGSALIALTNQMEDTERTKTEQLGACRYLVKASVIPSEVVTIVGKEIEKNNASKKK